VEEEIYVKLICKHPIQKEAVLPYSGQPVVAMTHHGDLICGTLESVVGGNVILKPLSMPAVQIQSFQKQLLRQDVLRKALKKRKGKAVVLTKTRNGKANVSFFGPGLGFGAPYGFGAPGYGYGYGAGLGWVIPLFLLAVLFTGFYF
jgi:hypothetical protein